MKKLSLFALAFAVVGLSACAEGDDTAVIDEEPAAEVETPVIPSDEAMDAEMEEMEDDMDAAGEEMMDDAEAATDEMEAEMDEEMMEDGE